MCIRDRDGALYRRAEAVADALTGYAAHLAAWIDYPEEEIAEVDPAELGGGCLLYTSRCV